MKKLAFYLICFGTLFSFQGCFKDKITRTYTIMIPVYKSKAEVYANIKSNPAKAIESPGKLFLYGQYIFLNEIDKGVHIIDNSDPSHPVVKAFIDIPGNLDIAVKGNTLYADLFTDLVTIDISNPMQASFVKFIPHVFPERNYGNGFSADSSRVIVSWIKKDTTVDYKPRGYMLYDMSLTSSSGGPLMTAAPSAPGVSGSMARFTITNNYLYCVNSWQLATFNITNTNDPQKIATNNVGWSIETIYPFKDKLFIGSRVGMFIYDISNPAAPVKTGEFVHATACDPVIADDHHAYITLHDGTPCQGFNNQLDVVSIDNLLSPTLVKTYAMTNPHGLTKDGNMLFVCDGRDGLKLFDATYPSNIILKKHIKGLETYDAIAWNNNLVVVAKDGLYQYSYSSPGTLLQKSKLSIKR